MSTQPQLTFIGAGNMATSIIGGLLDNDYPAAAITACDPNTESLMRMEQQWAIHTSKDNQHACQESEVIILAVKPQVLREVCESLAPIISQRDSLPMIVSIAAGISSEQIQTWLAPTRALAVVRCMPNTPALVGQGASGLYANEHVSDEQKAIAESLLRAVGYVTWLKEETLIDSVTAVSGSGPAYFFLLIEAMIESGVRQGLDVDSATELTLQTALGAATLAKSSDVSVDELRRRVTSPGGTTEQAIAHFESAGLRAIVDQAMNACADRSRDMAKESNQ